MYIAPSSGHISLNCNMPFKLILRRCEVVFWCLEWEYCTFSKTEMEIHSNPPILYYGFKKYGWFWGMSFRERKKRLTRQHMSCDGSVDKTQDSQTIRFLVQVHELVFSSALLWQKEASDKSSNEILMFLNWTWHSASTSPEIQEFSGIFGIFKDIKNTFRE